MISKIFYWIIIWLIPSNLFLKFLTSDAYVNGRLVDYLIPKIYALDLAILGFIIFSFLENWRVNRQTKQKVWDFKKVKKLVKGACKKPLIKILIGLLGILIIRQFFSNHPIVSLVYLLRVGLYSFFAFYATTQWIKLKKITAPAIIFSGLFQLVIAVYQFIYQKPLLAYQWLGETKINFGIGIAKATFAGTEQVLAYGTTAHPNILAGIMVFFWLWLLDLTSKEPNKKGSKRISLLGLGLVTVLTIIFMTQSVTALLGLILAIGTYQLQKKLSRKQIFLSIFTILILIPTLVHFSSQKWNNLSLTRRDRLNKAGINLFIKQPLLGTSLATSTTKIESVQTTPERVRFVQPPHYIIILLLTEVGILGGIIMVVILTIASQTKPFDKKYAYLWIFMAVVMALDHYLLTSSSGLIILLILFAKSFKE